MTNSGRPSFVGIRECKLTRRSKLRKRPRSPRFEMLSIKEKIQWVRPKLVCEVEYAELTADDQLRQTTFLGWRDDKKAQEVVLE